MIDEAAQIFREYYGFDEFADPGVQSQASFDYPSFLLPHVLTDPSLYRTKSSWSADYVLNLTTQR